MEFTLWFWILIHFSKVLIFPRFGKELWTIMTYLILFCFILFKLVISDRDVTNRKQISIPKVPRFSWLRVEGFESLFQQLKHQKLKTFLELLGKIYPDLVKVFFTDLEFKNDVLLSSIKGVRMKINKRAWKDVVGLKSKGVQVRKGEIGVVSEFNKMQYYGQCLRNPVAEIKHFHVGWYDCHKNPCSTW